jgi:hypothetical protein
MLSYLLLISFIQLIFGLEPSCTSCKHFIPHKLNSDLGVCNMFKDINFSNGKERFVYNFAVHCRNNENMCGKIGNLYESKNESKIESDLKDEQFFKDAYDELNNRCCGEVNERYELEQLEKEFFELYQKMKRYNTKRVYKTTRDLYKLFKNKDF